MADTLFVTERRLITAPDDQPGVPKPDVANTGPRIAVTGSTLSDINAVMAVANANDGVVSGRFIANMTPSQPGHVMTLDDCDITGAFFGIDAWFGQGTPPANDVRIILNHCIIHDVYGNSGIAGRNVVTNHCEFTRNADDFKPTSNIEVYASLLHDMWAAGDESHGDNIQFFGGDDVLIHWNTIVGLNSPDSPFNPGNISSSALQTSDGSVITNFRMNDNWVDGGVITLRGAEAHGGLAAQMEFRRNKHGRNFGSFPITGMGSFNGGLTVSDYDISNVWEDDGLPVLGS